MKDLINASRSSTKDWSAQSHEPSPAKRLATSTITTAAEVAEGFTRTSARTLKSSLKRRPSQLPRVEALVLRERIGELPLETQTGTHSSAWPPPCLAQSGRFRGMPARRG